MFKFKSLGKWIKVNCRNILTLYFLSLIFRFLFNCIDEYIVIYTIGVIALAWNIDGYAITRCLLNRLHGLAFGDSTSGQPLHKSQLKGVAYSAYESRERLQAALADPSTSDSNTTSLHSNPNYTDGQHSLKKRYEGKDLLDPNAARLPRLNEFFKIFERGNGYLKTETRVLTGAEEVIITDPSTCSKEELIDLFYETKQNLSNINKSITQSKLDISKQQPVQLALLKRNFINNTNTWYNLNWIELVMVHRRLLSVKFITVGYDWARSGLPNDQGILAEKLYQSAREKGQNVNLTQPVTHSQQVASEQSQKDLQIAKKAYHKRSRSPASVGLELHTPSSPFQGPSESLRPKR